ncbi:hypothetical protein CAEBREN_12404 [Caenorhabditis brenneri]|uniref:Nuclear receptor domain-containing protein n=1 Tax=Caenorhabditis brenneri TaxID=135651 RepID=G0NQA6_CAEBE|nr:hypothetical protein CAEBREN_12404 [Caenorhabditis brenneri]
MAPVLKKAENIPQLPPPAIIGKTKCKVCGGKKGVHQTTCQNCRTFFAINMTKVRQCITGKYKCKVTENTGSNCKRCWLEMCLKANMRRPKFTRILPTKSAELGPCKVCHAGSNNYLTSCGTCKNFYMENSSEPREEYKCIKDDNSCEIKKDTKEKCKSCWFKKCEEVFSKEKDKNQKVCQVCNNVVNRFYGALHPVCKNCGYFFHRNCDLELPPCQKNCKIVIGNRECCKSCRMRKCLESGMTASSRPVPYEADGMVTEVDAVKQPSNSNQSSSDAPEPVISEVPNSGMMNLNISSHSELSAEREVDCLAISDDGNITESPAGPDHSDEVGETTRTASTSRQTPRLVPSANSEVSSNVSRNSDESDDGDVDYPAFSDHDYVLKPTAAPGNFDEDGAGMEAASRKNNNLASPLSVTPEVSFNTSRHSDGFGDEEVNHASISSHDILEPTAAPGHSDESDEEMVLEAAPLSEQSPGLNQSVNPTISVNTSRNHDEKEEASTERKVDYPAIPHNEIREPSFARGHSYDAGERGYATRTVSTSAQTPRLVSSAISEVSFNASRNSDESNEEEVDYPAFSDYDDIPEPSATPGQSDESGDETMLEAATTSNKAPPTHQSSKLVSATPTFTFNRDSDAYSNEEADYYAMSDHDILEPFTGPELSDESGDEVMLNPASLSAQPARLSSSVIPEAQIHTSKHSDGPGEEAAVLHHDILEPSPELKAPELKNATAAPIAAATGNGLSVEEFAEKYNSKDLAGKQNMLKVTMSILARDAAQEFCKHCDYYNFNEKKETLEIKSFNYNADNDYFKNFEQLAQHYFEDFLKQIEKISSFFETAPGFEEFSRNDIKILIRQNIFVLHFLWCLPGFTGSEFILSDGTKLSKTELERIYSPKFFEDIPDFVEFCREELKMNENQRMLFILFIASQTNLPDNKQKFPEDIEKMIVQNYEGYEKMLMFMPGAGKYKQDVLQDILRNFNEFNRQMNKMMDRYRKLRENFDFPDSFDFYFGKEE